MTEQSFEAGLARDLVALADGEIRPFDVRSITERTVGQRRARPLGIPSIPRRWALPLLLALLGAALAAGLIAGQVVRPVRADTFHGVLIRGAGDRSGGSDTASVDVVLADPDGSERIVRRIHAPHIGADVSSIQSAGAVSPSGWLILYPGRQVRLGTDGALTWAVAFVDLTDPTKPPLLVPGHGAMGPRFGPDGLVGIPAEDGTVRVLDLDRPDEPERRIDGVAYVGGGPEIVWAADGSGFLAQDRAGVWGVRPLDGGPFRPGFPRTASRWSSPDVPGYWLESGQETPTGHWLSGGGLSAEGDGVWSLLEEADGVLTVSRAAIDGSDPVALRRLPIELVPGDPEGHTMATLDLAPDDSMAAIRVDPADDAPDFTLILRTRETRPDLPGARVDGMFIGWVTDSVARNIPSVPQPLALEPTGPMARARSDHAAAALPDGRILVTGGWDGWRHETDDRDCLTCGMNETAETYDPATGTFAQIASPVRPRVNHTATALADGRVLLVGGQDAAGNMLGTELYDPASGRFTEAARLRVSREDHVAAALPGGRVLVLGGVTDASVAPGTGIPETYDPATGAWTAGPSSDRLMDAVSATVSENGDALVFARVVSVFADPADSRGLSVYAGRSMRTRDRPARLGASLDDALFGTVRGSSLRQDGWVLFTLRDERNRDAWPGDDSGLYAIQPGSGLVELVATGLGRPTHGPVPIADGRVVVLADDPANCGPVTAWVIEPFSGGATLLGEVPGIGTCNGIPAVALTPVATNGLLISGGNRSGGETTEAATFIRPDSDAR
jgi:hypothetical protein